MCLQLGRCYRRCGMHAEAMAALEKSLRVREDETAAVVRLKREATRELERHRDELAAQLASARVSEQRTSRRLAALEEERRRLLLASPREARRQAIFLEAASVAIRAARR